MSLQFVFDFLSDLSNHNSKEWMDDNKKRYQEAKSEVVALVDQVIKHSLPQIPELADIEPKKTLFRINRDIRFSKNKDPYKTNFGASIVPGGKKSGNPGYYLHLQPGNNFVGGGIYQPPAEILKKVRQEIDYNGKELIDITSSKAFKQVYPEPFGGDRLKTAPKGYPKDHDYIHLLQLKHYVFMKTVSDAVVCKPKFAEEVADAFVTLRPFNAFIARAID